MNPEADDLYDRLGVDPVASMSDINKRITRFNVEYGDDYPEEKSEIERTLKDPERRREYNNKHDYPLEWESVGETVDLQIEGPEVVEKDEPVTITVTDDEGAPLSGVSIEVNDTDLGTTDENGRCSFSFDATGEATVTASKSTSGDRMFRDDSLEIDITSERRELSATADPSAATVGEPVTVTVTDGTGAVEGAVVKTPDGPERTDSMGECRLTLDRTGPFDLDVQKDDEVDVTYVSTTVSVDIDPERISLSLDADTSTVTVGDSVGFTVTDGTDGVRGATVTDGHVRETTDRKGRASLELSEAGTVTVEASKTDDATRSYRPDDVDVTVERRNIDIVVDVDGRVEVGDQVTVAVTDGSGTAVEDARVEATDRDYAGKTDGDGECQFRFSELGEVELVATKTTTATATYDRGTASLTVERASRTLEVTPSSGTVTSGSPVEFTVTDDAGNRIADAEIDTPSGTFTTGTDGTCEVTFRPVGSADITVRKTNTDTAAYTETTATVTVERRDVDLVVTTGSDTVKAGDEVDVLVRDDTGSRVEGAVVRCGSEREITNANGRCRLHPTGEGSQVVRAEKDNEPAVRYSNDTTTVKVTLEERALTLEADDEADAASTMTVQVHDDTGPVAEAIVESPSGQHSTGANGTAEIPLPAASVANLSARKAVEDGVKYIPASARVDLEGATGGVSADDDSEGLGTITLLLSVATLVAIPAVSSLFLLVPSLDVTPVLGAAVSLVLLLLFGLVVAGR